MRARICCWRVRCSRPPTPLSPLPPDEKNRTHKDVPDHALLLLYFPPVVVQLPPQALPLLLPLPQNKVFRYSLPLPLSTVVLQIRHPLSQQRPLLLLLLPLPLHLLPLPLTRCWTLLRSRNITGTRNFRNIGVPERCIPRNGQLSHSAFAWPIPTPQQHRPG